MRRRSKGFTLTELLTALVIHSFFILVLGGTFYTLISFGSRSQQVMTARERGQRVVNYIGSRIGRAGLGMWKLESSKKIREALAPMTASGYAFDSSNLSNRNASYHLANLTLPVVITYESSDNIIKDYIAGEILSKDNKIYGNVLTVLYAQRDIENANLVVSQAGITLPENISDTEAETILEDFFTQIDSNDTFWTDLFTNICVAVHSPEYKECIKIYEDSKDHGAEILDAAKYTLTAKYGTDAKSKITDIANDDNVVKYVSGYTYRYKFLYNRDGSYGEFYYSAFGEGEENIVSVTSNDMRAWGVSRGTGVPFTVDKYSASEKLLVKIKPSPESMDNELNYVPNADELLYLRCTRVYTSEPTDYEENNGMNFRSCRIRELKDAKWGTNQSGQQAYQGGVLELYMELDTLTNIFSLYVLSTGGIDNMVHKRPSYEDWPENARWKDDYANHVVYISKGTWKLNNLPKDFDWN